MQSNSEDIIAIGKLSPIDSGIVQALFVLSSDPAYEQMVFSQVKGLISVMYRDRYLAAVQQQRCRGILLYETLSHEAALSCIMESRGPQQSEFDRQGEAIYIAAIAGEHIRLLLKAFIQQHKGKLILFERHYHHYKKERINRFGYYDKQGRLRGKMIN